MRILFVTPVGMNRSSRIDFYLHHGGGTDEVPELPSTQPQYFWVKALRDQGHDVTVERYTDSELIPSKYSYGFHRRLEDLTSLGYGVFWRAKNSLPHRLNPELRARNERVVSTAIETDPDLVIVSGGFTELVPETAERIKTRTDATVAGISGVGPFDYTNAVEREMAVRHYDYLFTTCAHHTHAWRALGVNAVLLPTSGCSPEFADSAKERDERYSADVAFVGQPYPRRVMYFEALTEFDLALYGPRWDETPLTEYHRGEAWAEQRIRAIHNADIAVNIHHRYAGGGGNMRLFEAPVTGTMQIADYYDEDWYDEGKEIVSVRTPEELREAVRYYLENDNKRERIARRGYERAATDHTYSQRMARLVRIVENEEGVPDGVVGPEYIQKYSTTPHWGDPVQ